MKISSYAVARPSYYDRGAVTTFNVFFTLLTPAGLTTRFTSTVAAGKKMQLEAVGVSITTETVSAPAGRNIMMISITSGATEANIARLDATNVNIVNSFRADIKAYNLTLFAGETIYAESLDVSTGGSQYFAAFSKGSTFDA